MKKIIKNYNRSNRKLNHGFTLIELIVVMAVIAILVLLAAPKFLNKASSAKETATKHDAKVLGNSAEMLFMVSHDFLNNLEVVPLEELQSLVDSGELWGPSGKVSSLNPSLTYYRAPKSFIKEDLEINWNNEDGYLSSELEGFVSRKINGTVSGGKKEPTKVECNLALAKIEDWNYAAVEDTIWPLPYKQLNLSGYIGTNKDITIPLNVDASSAPYGLSIYEQNTNLESICIPSGFTEADISLTDSGQKVIFKTSAGLKNLRLTTASLIPTISSPYNFKESLVSNGVILSGDADIEDWNDLLEDSGLDYVFVNMGGTALPPDSYLLKKYGAENLGKAYTIDWLTYFIEEQSPIVDIPAFSSKMLEYTYSEHLVEWVYPQKTVWTSQDYKDTIPALVESVTTNYLNYLSNGTKTRDIEAYLEMRNPPVIPIPANTISKNQFYAAIGNTENTKTQELDYTNISLNKVYVIINETQE